MINKVGLETGGAVINLRAEAAELISMIGGKQIHPVCGLPGGVSTAITAEQRDRMVQITTAQVEFAKFSLQLFDDVVLKNNDYVDLIKSDVFTHETYYMGLVDEDNKVNFYDGKVRVVGPDGAELEKFEGGDYLEHIAEHVEPYSYLVYPVPQVGRLEGLRGRQGLRRLPGLAAQPPQRRRRHGHAARPAGVRALLRHARRQAGARHAGDALGAPGRAALRRRARPRAGHRPGDHRPQRAHHPHRHRPGEGVGVVEAPRGTLYHHYKTDEKGIVTNVNLIVGTTNNNAAISHVAQEGRRRR